jgi:hypothetical protein
MSETVSKLAAFVFQHGAMSWEIVFRDVQSEGELPGLRAEEREAIERAKPHLRETWIGILSACREAFWAVAADHECASQVVLRKTQALKMYETGAFSMTLVKGDRATAGVTLDAWDDAPSYHLYPWCWTQVRYRAVARAAVAHLDAQWNDRGVVWLTLDPPREGESYEAVGARTATALWSLARPIAEAVAQHANALQPALLDEEG